MEREGLLFPDPPGWAFKNALGGESGIPLGTQSLKYRWFIIPGQKTEQGMGPPA